MRFATLGAITGLVISISWIIWGFFAMLAIVLTTLILAGIGFFLDTIGFSLNKLATKMLDKFAN